MEQKDEQGVKMSNLQIAMQLLIDVFHSYSGKEGDKYKLNNAEMKNLLQGELKDFLSCGKNPEEVDKIMATLDDNLDGEVDFQEFVVLVGSLTIVCNDFFEDLDRSCSANQQQKQQQK